jgi:hypothetical protein
MQYNCSYTAYSTDDVVAQYAVRYLRTVQMKTIEIERTRIIFPAHFTMYPTYILLAPDAVSVKKYLNILLASAVVFNHMVAVYG